MSTTTEKKIVIIFEDHRDPKAQKALMNIIGSKNGCHITDITIEDNNVNMPLSQLMERYKLAASNAKEIGHPTANAFEASAKLLKMAEKKDIKVHPVDVDDQLTNQYHDDYQKDLHKLNYEATQFIYKNGCRNLECSEKKKIQLMKKFADTEKAKELFLETQNSNYIVLRDQHIATEISAIYEKSEGSLAVQMGWGHTGIMHALESKGYQVIPVLVDPGYETLDLNDIMLKYHTPFLQENILAGVDIINAENLSPEQISKHIIGECEQVIYTFEL